MYHIRCSALRDGKQALLHMLPRTAAARAIGQKAIPVPSQFFFHHVNAFEPAGCADAARVVLDSIPWTYMDFGIVLDMLTPQYFIGGTRTQYTRFDVVGWCKLKPVLKPSGYSA